MDKLATELEVGPSRTFSYLERTETEPSILRFLKTATLAKEGQAHWIEVMNLYVALKSKPMAILYGPASSGKDDAVRLIG